MPRPASAKILPPELLGAEDLPSPPSVAIEVLRLTRDENSTMADLARALECDPALSARLLKLANSSAFGPGYAVTTVHRAAMVLGLKTVRLMALSFSLAEALPREGQPAGLQLQSFWRRSIVNAAAARALAERLPHRLADEAFLCGLLGHIGRLVLARVLPEQYRVVLAENDRWPDTDAEERALGFHSADVTDAVLRSWSIPPEVVEPLRLRQDHASLLREEDERLVELGNVLRTALLVEELFCGQDRMRVMRELTADAAEKHGFAEPDLDDFLVRLESAVAETAELLDVELPSGLSHQELIESARLQVINVSMGINVELRQATRRSEELEGRNRELRTAANTDQLTGLANRKHFDDFLARQICDRLSAKVPRALGLILVDLDHFKRLNDNFGHDAGDEVLRMVGAVLARSTRRGDLPARYGGEEFAVVMPQTTPFALRTAAERLRRAIEAESLAYAPAAEGAQPAPGGSRELRVTASFGGVCIAELDSEDDARRIVQIADRNLYKAKELGRNRVEITKQVVRLPRR